MEKIEKKDTIIERIIEERTLQLQKQYEELKELKVREEETKKMLEVARKKDEETYLKPILAYKKLKKIEIDEQLTKYEESLSVYIDKFLSQKDKVCAKHLLGIYKEYKRITGFRTCDIDEKIKLLFDYFLETEDADSCRTFLQVRDGLYLSENYIAEKEKYTKYISDFTKFIYTDKSGVCMGFGKYREDVLTYMELLGKLDARSHDGDEEVYYSEKSKEDIIIAATGGFGDLRYRIYYDGEFGHEERDREILMEFHDKAYKEEKAYLKLIETKEEV